MKNWMLTPVLLAFVACNSGNESGGDTPEMDSTAVSEEVAVNEVEYFGAEITMDNAISTEEMLAELEGKDSAIVKVSGEISGVCQKKGCWMDIPLANGETMKVKFKDYEFFVPMNSMGKTAVVEGVVKQETFSVAYLQHLAHDAGKSQEEIDAITEPEVAYSFLANGVAIK